MGVLPAVKFVEPISFGFANDGGSSASQLDFNAAEGLFLFGPVEHYFQPFQQRCFVQGVFPPLDY
jgi:hypothetical protein